jgi:hypothetical protein
MEQFYTQALISYKDYKYPDLHKYICRKTEMTDWYKVFLLDITTPADVDVEVEAKKVEEDAVVEAPPVVAKEPQISSE